MVARPLQVSQSPFYMIVFEAGLELVESNPPLDKTVEFSLRDNYLN